MAEPAFLGPGLASGCEPPGSDSVFAAVESVCVLVVAVEPGVAGFELVGPPVDSEVFEVLETEPVCAFAGKASIPSKKATITGLGKCLGEASGHMS
jgi:hypothetical protein